MKRNLLFSSILILVVIFLGASRSAQAGPPERHCGMGEVQAALQALPVGFYTVSNGLSDIKMGGLGAGVANCQYRLFFDGQTFTFSTSNRILGGVVYMLDYQDQGMTRSEAIQAILAIQDRVFLGPEGGPLVEQELTTTTFKDMVHPALGHIVYQHRAIITQLPPGEYESLWMFSHPVIPDFSATVHLDIEP